MKTLKLKITRNINKMQRLVGGCQSKDCVFSEDDCKGTGQLPCDCGVQMRDCMRQLDKELKSVKL